MADGRSTPPADAGLIDRLGRDYRQGASLAHLAASTGWSATKVRYVLIAAGITMRPPSPVLKDRPWWVQQIDGGATVPGLARQLDVTERTILTHLTRWNLQPSSVTVAPVVSFDQWLAQRVEPDLDCLRWTGWHTTTGYPITRVNGRKVIVRRIVWQQHHGPIAVGVEVLRAAGCRFLDCVALAHLYLAGAARRVAELVEEAAFVHGEQHWKTRLSTEQARFIRSSTQTPAELARRFDVSRASIHAIQAGRRWRHLDQTILPTRPSITPAQPDTVAPVADPTPTPPPLPQPSSR